MRVRIVSGRHVGVILEPGCLRRGLVRLGVHGHPIHTHHFTFLNLRVQFPCQEVVVLPLLLSLSFYALVKVIIKLFKVLFNAAHYMLQGLQ